MKLAKRPMLRVVKGVEPSCLADARREVKRVEEEAGAPVADVWACMADKDALRAALVRDQRGLCVHPVQHPVDPATAFAVNLGASLGMMAGASTAARAHLAELNLNGGHLPVNRGRVVAQLRAELKRTPEQQVGSLMLRRYLAVIRGTETLPPYAHVVAAYLGPKLRGRRLIP